MCVYWLFHKKSVGIELAYIQAYTVSVEIGAFPSTSLLNELLQFFTLVFSFFTLLYQSSYCLGV